jgi:hypothetical protein
VFWASSLLSAKLLAACLEVGLQAAGPSPLCMPGVPSAAFSSSLERCLRVCMRCLGSSRLRGWVAAHEGASRGLQLGQAVGHPWAQASAVAAHTRHMRQLHHSPALGACTCCAAAAHSCEHDATTPHLAILPNGVMLCMAETVLLCKHALLSYWERCPSRGHGGSSMSTCAHALAVHPTQSPSPRLHACMLLVWSVTTSS